MCNLSALKSAQAQHYGTCLNSIMNAPIDIKPAVKIIAYLKPTCGWSQGVRAALRKYQLPFEDRDIINNLWIRQEMIEKSGQPLSPCVEVNGIMLADVSGDEVEQYLLKNGIVQPTAAEADFPTNRACNAHHRD